MWYLLYNTTIPLLGIYPTEMKTYFQKQDVEMNVHTTCIYKKTKLETTKCHYQ